MVVRHSGDIRGLVEAGKVAAETVAEMAKKLRPGVTTGQLDGVGEGVIKRYGAESAPRYFYRFPGATCVSVLPVIAHGIPGDQRIRPGDVVNIDVSVYLNGFCADTGMTVLVEPKNVAAHKICRAASAALKQAIKIVKPRVLINEVGKVVQAEAERHGLKVVRNICGHGLGATLHEAPEYIINFYNAREKSRFAEGQVVAIEPFISSGAEYAKEKGDGWGLTVPRGCWVAQYEHTLILLKDETVVTTARA
ncbi:MAG: type I methionyl aminopeptidase [Peptococcaceae bacterium]|nr:type I methionyl aminopeptidase [Peptococcaceae bacterium]